MSPTSSSTPLVGRNARSATLRTISLPLLGMYHRLPVRRPANSTLMRRAASPPPTCRLRSRRARASRRRGLVARDRCGAAPLWQAWALAGRRPARRARVPAAAAAAQGRAREPKGRSRAVVQRELPARAGGRATRASCSTRGSQHRRAHGAQRGGHARLVRLHLELPQLAARQAAGLDRSNRARRESPAARADRRKSTRPAAARPPTSTPGRSGPLAPGRRATFVGT